MVVALRWRTDDDDVALFSISRHSGDGSCCRYISERSQDSDSCSRYRKIAVLLTKWTCDGLDLRGDIMHPRAPLSFRSSGTALTLTQRQRRLF